MRWIPIFTVWLGIAVAMILNGLLREVLFTPNVGPLRAHQLSSLTGSFIILAASYLALPWLSTAAGIGSTGLQLRIGLVWLVTTILFEFGFGHWVAEHSWHALFQDYNLAAGRIWVLVLLVTLLGPWVAGRLRP